MSTEPHTTSGAEAPRFPLPGYNGRRLVWQERDIEGYMRALVGAPPLPPAPPEEPVKLSYFRDVTRRTGWSGRQLHRQINWARERATVAHNENQGDAAA